jgi:hypothetical protein
LAAVGIRPGARTSRKPIGSKGGVRVPHGDGVVAGIGIHRAKLPERITVNRVGRLRLLKPRRFLDVPRK